MRWAAGLSVPGVPNNPTPAQVVSLSLGGGTTCSPTLQSAVNDVIANGTVVVAANGNEGSTTLSSPANCNGVIAVTAHTINGENADYANIGTMTAISSPGGGTPSQLGLGGETDDSNWHGYYIWSTILFGNMGPLSTDSQGRSGPAYSGFTGTSAATPQVAGVAALVKSILPLATPAQIRSFITSNARAFPAGSACAPGGAFAGSCGAGLLDARVAPSVVTPPQNVTTVAGQTAIFGVSSVGLGPFSYQWHRDGAPIAGATGASYLTPPLAVTDSGATFTVAITNVITTTVSPAATVTVNAAPPAGAPPPTGGGGGGGALPFWQLLLLGALLSAARTRTRNRASSFRPSAERRHTGALSAATRNRFGIV